MGTVGHEVSIGMLGSGLLRILSVGHEIVAGCNVHKGSDPDYVSVPEREGCCETVRINYRYGTGSHEL